MSLEVPRGEISSRKPEGISAMIRPIFAKHFEDLCWKSTEGVR